MAILPKRYHAKPERKRCYLCASPVNDKTPKHDVYAEYVFSRPDLLVCDGCHDDLQHEDGPWNEVR